MWITFDEFERNYMKYMKLALIMDITVVDLENRRSWVISRGEFPEEQPRWIDLLSGALRKAQTNPGGGVYA